MGLKAFREGLPNFDIIASCIPAPGSQVTITSPMYHVPFLLSVALLAWLAGAFHILLAYFLAAERAYLIGFGPPFTDIICVVVFLIGEVVFIEQWGCIGGVVEGL